MDEKQNNWNNLYKRFKFNQKSLYVSVLLNLILAWLLVYIISIPIEQKVKKLYLENQKTYNQLQNIKSYFE